MARLRQIVLKGLRYIATQATRHGLRRDGLRSIFCSPHKWPGQREQSELRPLAQPWRLPFLQRERLLLHLWQRCLHRAELRVLEVRRSAINGAPEGYVMDQQLKWLEQTVQKFEADPKIDHAFVIMHSAMFPTGDHSDAGMWFFGSNAPRPMINGVKTDKGIIERRDQIIDVCINHTKKVLGFLTGSEHNFSTLTVTPTLPIYPDNYSAKKLAIKRTFTVVNNGGGGAYSYANINAGEYHTPFNDKFQHFTGPTSMAIFHVNGLSVTLDAYNPETFERIVENVRLR